MSIEGTEYMGNWGKKIPIDNNSHISQTNSFSDDGLGAHITTNIRGTNIKVQDRFDAYGNFLGSNFGER